MTRAEADAAHAPALAAGATRSGAPGLRPHIHSDYHGAYIRDLDGTKLRAVRHRAE